MNPETESIFSQDLTHDDISQFLPHLSALAALNQELAAGDLEHIWRSMQDPNLGLERLETGNKTRCCVSSDFT